LIKEFDKTLEPFFSLMNLTTEELKELNEARKKASVDQPKAPPKKGLFW